MNAKQLIANAEQRLMTEKHKTLKEATATELHNAISGAAMDAVAPIWKKKEDVADSPHIVKLLEGMTASKPDSVSILYSRGCDWTEVIETKYGELGDERAWEYDILHRKVDAGEKADKQEALNMAQECDVIVAAVGENVMLCGENRDRQGLRLPGKQEQFVEELIQTGKPVVLVMFGGRAQVVSGLAERCAAVIQAW